MSGICWTHDGRLASQGNTGCIQMTWETGVEPETGESKNDTHGFAKNYSERK